MSKTTVTTAWLQENLDRIVLLDATVFMRETTEGLSIESGYDAYRSVHLPQAQFANLLEDFSDQSGTLTAAPHNQFVTAVRRLGVDDSSTVVIYDRGAVVGAPFMASDWASRLWWQFRLSGHDDVFVLAGGFDKWHSEGRPTTSDSYEVSPGNFEGKYRPELLATKEDVFEAMSNREVALLNCLSGADFRGESNNYPRPGHIPSSVNIFFGDVSDADSQGLPSQERLTELFGDVLDKEKIIAYCGGGIAATWNAMALFELGRHDVAVYDGSLMEWASDESLPLER
ncbi:sulfurtransferase [Paenalkalicoccus suaedae]|uniref:Sulfurtransferase n=1 Tax=Paenalkalicoccus suaedae TaxID=2592382 RepID=A0A859FG21_9BACI|nr:sulfurtransferase [Paenalkalicoccus suaedae]QKS72313.1 sulfurtransferase [Paenalkalicoccus suaedae]